MFLAESDIRKHLSKGDLVIDPAPSEAQLGGAAVDLRLGSQFARNALGSGVSAVDLADPLRVLSSVREVPLESVPIGQHVTLSSGERVIATTLEYVHLPLDLLGLLFPRAALERLGLTVGTGTVEPGFQGKLALSLHNTSSAPLLLYPGLRVTRLCLAKLSARRSERYSPRYRVLKGPVLSEIESIRGTIEETAPRLSARAPSAESMARSFAEVLAAEGTSKGKALEDFVAALFASLEGLRVLKRNARLAAEELDLIIKNDVNTGFWRIAGSPLIVECKNWSGKVGAPEISVLVEKLQALSPDAKSGILVALNGITGDSYSDAMLKIREARQRGRYVLVLERRDLEEAASGVSLAQVIERKYEAMIMI